MVTTRRQSKDFDPVELPPVTHRKRKRSKDATPAPSLAQPPNQHSTKRRKKVKSTARVDAPAVPTHSASIAPPKATASGRAKEPVSVKTTEGKARKDRPQARNILQSKANHTGPIGTGKPAELDLTRDNDSSDGEPAQRPRTVASRDADDEEADSRYALGPRRKGKTKKSAAPTARRTAELKFEEDGLEEVDKASAAVSDASNRVSSQSKDLGSMPGKPVKHTMADRACLAVEPQGKGLHKPMATHNKGAPPSSVPSKTVMYTIIEAIAALSLYKDGTMSVPTRIDPQSRQPYEPLQTGESLSYPVKGTYHLGALGRYGINTSVPLPFSLITPLSEYSFIQRTHDSSTTEPSRHGLGFSSSLAARPQVPATRRPNNYCFTFGKYRGRRMDSVPISYLRSIFNSDEYHADSKLQQALADLYPKGLYESEAESYTFEKGGFKGKRFDEVPKSYLWGLLRKKNEGELVGGKKGRGKLERALEVWEKSQLDLTKD